jgi:hypothetical protein
LDAPLTRVPFDTLDRRTGAEWIKLNYPSADLWGVKAGPLFNWRQSSKEYNAIFESGQKNITVALSPEPTISEVTKCLGNPEVFTLMKLPAADGVGTQLSLWYPTRGLVFQYTGFNQKRVINYSEQSVLNGVVITKPGVILDLASQIYSEEGAREIVASAKAWPTNFASIELDSK